MYHFPGRWDVAGEFWSCLIYKPIGYSMILGSCIMAVITKLSSDQTDMVLEALNTTSEPHKMERRFSEMEM